MRLAQTLVASLLLALPLAALAEDAAGPDPRLHAPPSVDVTPTTWSCTADTLFAGADCVFESEAEPAKDEAAQARENAKQAAALGTRACGSAARLPSEAKADRDLLALCQKDFAAAADSCAADGKQPLLDARGRFSPQARPCYQAMSEVIRRTAVMAAVTTKCCRCLVKNRCARSAEACNRALPRMENDEATSACMASACGEVCDPLIPIRRAPEPTDPEEQPKASKGKPAKNLKVQQL